VAAPRRAGPGVRGAVRCETARSLRTQQRAEADRLRTNRLPCCRSSCTSGWAGEACQLVNVPPLSTTPRAKVWGMALDGRP